MAKSGAVTLGDIADKPEVLRIECSKCDRKGRHLVERLLAQHCPAMPLPELLATLATTCPKQRAISTDRCGVHAPDLVKLATMKPLPL